ncbi:MAG TPA: hypothetical protein VKO42_04350 [Patescibacteria group bacterium]|nr:hypothetical protein [Patescibacteria group bacterium]
MTTKRRKKGFYCEKHPEFDPCDPLSKEGLDEEKGLICRCCSNLRDGVKPIGYFGGEHKADPLNIWKAKTKIGPLTLEQLGKVRLELGWDYHFDLNGAPSWLLDKESMVVYVLGILSEKKIREFKEAGCPIFKQTWKVPELKEIKCSSEKDKEVKLSFRFGNSGTKISFFAEEGMTVGELSQKLWELLRSLDDIPNDSVLERQA